MQGDDGQEYLWNWDQQTFSVTYETLGQGSPVLLLPGVQFQSLRVQEIAARLATQHQAVTLDWLGFGQSERLPDYAPTLFHQLLQDFVIDVFGTCGDRCCWSCRRIRLATGSQKTANLLPVLVAPTCEVLTDNGRESVCSGCSASAGDHLNWSSSLQT